MAVMILSVKLDNKNETNISFFHIFASHLLAAIEKQN
jgi:hypothetical protein